MEGAAMDWPYHFPHPADVIAREAERFRALPPAEQIREILELAELGHRQLEASPRRPEILEEIARSEEEWREAHRRVFAKFGF